MYLRTIFKRSQYSVLQDKDSITPDRSWSFFTGPLKLPKSTLIVLLLLLTSLISGIGGYFAGKRWALGKNETLVQLNRVPKTFEYEFNFAEAPSNLTNSRWNSLFPLHGGFFEHPSVGPASVAFAVFHQLHCLDGIRNAYWTVRNGNHSKGHSRHAEHSSDTHIRHCLEYLRQSIMCAADTTIELAENAPEGNWSGLLNGNKVSGQ
ncbi:hypothetical protein HYFRA_00005456 [Hymenoscyphus fraxineus]|uniref:Oxidase ustYa n=1 Tax=Hymenoscyphus fraxineus TaxID=746836 RepID=A0A9N9KQQ1_9HELO|nr:hypothetical protein HYFRA_00005456 [Hymenoscyphus fraxineus]